MNCGKKITIFETKNGVCIVDGEVPALSDSLTQRCWTFDNMKKANKLVGMILKTWHGIPPTDQEKRIFKL